MRTTNVLQKQAQAKKGQHADRYCLARPINGISLNGDEYLLDDDNEIKWFPTEKDAYAFCQKTFVDLEMPTVDEVKGEDIQITFKTSPPSPSMMDTILSAYGIYIRHESEVQNG